MQLAARGAPSSSRAAATLYDMRTRAVAAALPKPNSSTSADCHKCEVNRERAFHGISASRFFSA